jgi:hypothetical protein
LWAIAHCFGVMGGLTWPMTLSTCLRGMSKTCRFYIFGPFSWAIVHSFGFSRCFSSPWHLVLVWSTWPKTRRFCVYGRFCELLPTIWGSGGFTWPMTLSTCLRGMTKNSPFLRFRAVFMNYCWIRRFRPEIKYGVIKIKKSKKCKNFTISLCLSRRSCVGNLRWFRGGQKKLV